MTEKKYMVQGFENQNTICPICEQPIHGDPGGFLRYVRMDDGRDVAIVCHINCCSPAEHRLRRHQVNMDVLAASMTEDSRSTLFFRGWGAFVRGDKSWNPPGKPFPPGALIRAADGSAQYPE
jgi:hypothetical protein